MNPANVSFLAAETGFLVWFAVRNASAWSTTPENPTGGTRAVRQGAASATGASGGERGRLAGSGAWPDTFGAFCARFSTEEACAAFLREVRFPRGFSCPGCGTGETRPAETPRFIICAHGHHTSLVAGSVMAGGSVPLVLWFRAAWLLASGQSDRGAMDLLASPGLSVSPQRLSLRDSLRVLARTRSALSCGEGTSLHGEVELGFVMTRAAGGPPETVAMARERRGETGAGAGRMVIRLLDEPTRAGMCRFVSGVVGADATLLLDGDAIWSELHAWERRILPRNEARSEEMAVALGEAATAMRGLGGGWLRRVEAQGLLDSCAAAWNRIGDPAVAFCRALALPPLALPPLALPPLALPPLAVGTSAPSVAPDRVPRLDEAVSGLRIGSLGAALVPGC